MEVPRNSESLGEVGRSYERVTKKSEQLGAGTNDPDVCKSDKKNFFQLIGVL